MKLVNLNLAKHPLNWFVIWSMALILFFGGHLLISHCTGKHPGGDAGNGSDDSVAGPGTVAPQHNT